jgi:hypothetical protein
MGASSKRASARDARGDDRDARGDDRDAASPVASSSKRACRVGGAVQGPAHRVPDGDGMTFVVVRDDERASAARLWLPEATAQTLCPATAPLSLAWAVRAEGVEGAEDARVADVPLLTLEGHVVYAGARGDWGHPSNGGDVVSRDASGHAFAAISCGGLFVFLHAATAGHLREGDLVRIDARVGA